MLTKSVIVLVSLLPGISFAQGKNLSDIAILIVGYLNLALAMIIGLAVVTFVWNVYLYFFTEKDKAEAGKYVMYSVIGFFVILSFWGIVAVVMNSLQLQNQRPDTLPSFFMGGSRTNSKIPSPGGETTNNPVRGGNTRNP